jgi:putative ABC transport system permease protein
VRLARLLGWLIPASDREFILGDLEEAYGARPASRYAWELVKAAWACRRHRPRHTWYSLITPSRGDSFVTTLLSDLRYGLRQLAVRPGFTALAVLTLALGIGATTAIFSVVNPILFQSLPYPNPDRIVRVTERGKDGGPNGTGFATFVDVHNMSTSFEALSVNSQWQPTLQSNGDPERLNGQRVTREFFSVFGVRPVLGRDFTEEENVRGKHHVTILSYGLWQRRFGSDPSVVGKPITFDGIQYLVVGVMPKRFESLISPTAELWAPLGYDVSLPWACRTCHHLNEYGRLKPGITPEAARRELDVISGRLVAQYPTEYAAAGMLVTPLQEVLTQNVKGALLAVLGAVGLVLLIACANVSSLLLGRAMQREGEFAIRGALGARQGRVIRQLLTESVILSLVGGAAGAGLAWVGILGLKAIAPPNLPRLEAIGINGGVLGFTAGVSILTGLLFGLIPAFATARPDLFTALRPGGRHTGHRSKRMARAVLVGGEVALAVMLLVGAGLLMRSLERVLAVDPGFDPRNLLTLTVQTTGARYNDNEPTWAFWERTLEAVRAVPGVEMAAWTSQLPLGGNFDRYGVQIQGKVLANPEEAPAADRFSVTPDYLQTMRIPLKRGRAFTTADVGKNPPVVIINETLARVGWGGGDPIGGKVQYGGPDQPWRTVVGIVGTVQHTALDQDQAPQLYIPESQGQFADGSMALAVRTRGDPAALAAAVRAAITSVDPTQPILGVATMDQVVSATAQQRRFTFLLFQVFAVVALLLAAAGIYGVLAGSVTERTREIGIRSALGAPRTGLLRMVVRQGLSLAVIGLAVGTVGALGLTQFLQKMLFGVSARDPLTFGAVMVVLFAVSLGACLAPALRATRVSPLEALRSE